MSQVAETLINPDVRPSPSRGGWLERASDRLSPILIKEVRQIVKARDFSFSFLISLAAGMGVAFFGAADAMTGGNAGSWTFMALTTCLAFIGLAVVPLGAFNTLRNERLEQTFDLIALTALTPRQIIIGKLLAQSVKLTTMFAAMAPFIAMSFLLGGIDFVTIVFALILVFAWAVWVCAASIFVSTIPKTRAMSGFIFAGLGIGLLLLFFVGRTLFTSVLFSPFGPFGGGRAGGPITVNLWWTMGVVMSACAVTLTNLVLLAENRLTSPTDDRSTALRVGFLLQFLVLLGWALTYVTSAPPVRDGVFEVLGVLAGVHLAVVSAFTVTEDVARSRRVRLRLAAHPRWRRWMAMLRPGARAGAGWVALQMGLLIAAGWALRPAGDQLRWLLAICGFVAVFTGLPTALARAWRPSTPSWILRVIILFVFALSLILPDVIYFVVWQPELFSLNYSARHLLNPIMTLANWTTITSRGWEAISVAVAIGGLLSFIAVIMSREGGEDGGQPAPQFFPSIRVPADGREGDGGAGN